MSQPKRQRVQHQPNHPNYDFRTHLYLTAVDGIDVLLA